MMIRFGFLILTALFFAACTAATPAPTPPPTTVPAPTDAPVTAESPTPSAGSPFDLANTSWVLVSIMQNGAVQTTVPGTQVTLIFAGDGTFTGNGGCNMYGGQYTTQGEILTMTNIFATERACLEPEKNQLESAYFQALGNAQLFELRDDQLTITFDNGAGTLTYTNPS